MAAKQNIGPENKTVNSDEWVDIFEVLCDQGGQAVWLHGRLEHVSGDDITDFRLASAVTPSDDFDTFLTAAELAAKSRDIVGDFEGDNPGSLTTGGKCKFSVMILGPARIKGQMKVASGDSAEVKVAASTR